MPNLKARVFISHSAKEPAAQELQAALVEALKASPDVVPLMDKTDLEPGDMWRSRINLWVGGCDAAVILLSGRALTSDWVFYEAALLTYRRACDPGFLVVPVYVEVAADAVQTSHLHPTEITEIQAIQTGGRPVPEVVADIVQALEKAVCCGDSPVERRAKRLADLLKFDKEELQEAAGFIDYNLESWLPAANARLLLAVQLQAVGMTRAVPALLKLRQSLPWEMSERKRADWLQQVTNLVASSWVDHRSTDRIPPIAKRQVDQFALGLNAAWPLTAEMYVLCSSAGEPEPWKVVSSDGVVAQDSIAETIQALSDKVSRALIKGLKLTCKATTEVAAYLEKRDPIYPRPVFVSLPGQGISNEILLGLRKAFPRVTFFLLMGEDEGMPLEKTVLEILFPQLVQGDEEIFLDTYHKFHDNVCLS